MTSHMTPELLAVLADLKLPDLHVVADQAGIAALAEKPAGKYTFAQALRLALAAFLSDDGGSDGRGRDSAMAVVRSSPDSFGLEAKPSDEEITEALRAMLAGDPKAQIVLLTEATIKEDTYRFPPEYGESISENWVFRIIIPSSWPLLQWSIVDAGGQKPAYSYNFD